MASAAFSPVAQLVDGTGSSCIASAAAAVRRAVARPGNAGGRGAVAERLEVARPGRAGKAGAVAPDAAFPGQCAGAARGGAGGRVACALRTLFAGAGTRGNLAQRGGGAAARVRSPAVTGTARRAVAAGDRLRTSGGQPAVPAPHHTGPARRRRTSATARAAPALAGRSGLCTGVLAAGRRRLRGARAVRLARIGQLGSGPADDIGR